MLRFLFLVLALLTLVSCTKSKKPVASGQEPVQKEVSLGRCFGAGGVGCQGNSGCRPPFVTCQEGSCCSGELDPKTCECSCAGGPACGPGQWCCKGHPNHVPALADLGVLKCRPQTDCIDNAP
jgi:hypothetical protein